MYGDQAARIFLASLNPESSILDIGSGQDGNGFGAMCRAAGHTYQPFDLVHGESWENTATRTLYARRGRVYDGVYLCHSLEHMDDTHSALTAIHHVLKEGGVLGITVPPMKGAIVGGHKSLWNAGMLWYRLILAGFDLSGAATKTYGYNVSVVVRRKPIEYMPNLKHDSGDITTLSDAGFFPMRVGDGFDGQIKEYQWGKV